MTVNDFNTIQTMFENEMKDKLINQMRKIISDEISIGNKEIRARVTLSKKIEVMEKTANRIKPVIDFMFSCGVLNTEEYRSEYDRLIDWEVKKIGTSFQ